jgi:RNA polymerase sigma-70 factor, ECF subfamily
MYISLKNRAIDFLRSKKTEFSLEEVFFEAKDRESIPDDKLTVLEALRKLSSDYQEVLFLKFYQGFSFREIGEMLKISVNTAASRYRYALDKLSKVLEGEI